MQDSWACTTNELTGECDTQQLTFAMFLPSFEWDLELFTKNLVAAETPANLWHTVHPF